MRKPKIDLIFEVSWEVCNKVGGIYTVLSSKAGVLESHFPDKLIFIGPDFGPDSDCTRFFTEDPETLGKLRPGSLPFGISVRIGNWSVPGNPLAVLVDFKNLYDCKNDFYGQMWNDFGVDSLHAYGDYDDACAFSLASAIVIGAIYKAGGKKYSNVIAHFNEWTTGMGLLYLKKNYPDIATVFTTHATCIGRSICGNNKPLYNYLQFYNGDQMAAELNMESKHSLEKTAVHNADCYTTVSDVTGEESRQLLGKAPDVVTPNGFERELCMAGNLSEKTMATRARKALLEVASALTGKNYPKNTLIVATSGRNEYHNKGIDLFLDAMNALKIHGSKRHCVAFILVPAWTKEPRHDLKEAVARSSSVGGDRILTHWLNNPWEDSIYNRIKELGFNDDENSNVDLVYMPCYLNGSDGILNIPYYDLLRGFDLTVFPSYYEPWGYTPLESIAFGVPTVTTSLSGFGQWIIRNFPDKSFIDTGVEVIPRDDFNYWEVVGKITSLIYELMNMKPTLYKVVRESAKLTAANAEWTLFIKHYVDAYAKALENRTRRMASQIPV